ncbi:MAG: LolA family protein [Methyloligellaceae bacterium]
MCQRLARTAVAAAGLALCVAVTPVGAAENQTPPEQQQQQQQTNPAGGGANWSTEVQPSQTPATPETPAASENSENSETPAEQFDPEAVAQIGKINAYFNNITHLEGRFTQIDPNNDRTNGRFYVHRPGKLRFDYAPPSKMRIVSDGQYLTIEDHDLNTVDKFPLDSTPFKLLLAQDVDLLRDARIVTFKTVEGLIMLTLEDKAGDSPGQLQLFFGSPEIELKQWVITDPQGLNTQIQVADLVEGREVGKKFFDTTTVNFPSFSD